MFSHTNNIINGVIYVIKNVNILIIFLLLSKSNINLINITFLTSINIKAIINIPPNGKQIFDDM